MAEHKELELSGAVFLSNAACSETEVRALLSRCRCGSIVYEGVRDCMELIDRYFLEEPEEVVDVGLFCEFGYLVLSFYRKELVLGWSAANISQKDGAQFIEGLYKTLKADAAFVGVGGWIAQSRDDMVKTLRNRAGYKHWGSLEL